MDLWVTWQPGRIETALDLGARHVMIWYPRREMFQQLVSKGSRDRHPRHPASASSSMTRGSRRLRRPTLRTRRRCARTAPRRWRFYDVYWFEEPRVAPDAARSFHFFVHASDSTSPSPGASR
jgi:hypothetical protein